MPHQREINQHADDDASSSGTSDYEDWDPTNPAHAKADLESSDQKEGSAGPSVDQAASHEGHGGGGLEGQAASDLQDASGMPLSQEEADRMLKAADEVKVEGNRLFGEGKFAEAATKYKEAISKGLNHYEHDRK